MAVTLVESFGDLLAALEDDRRAHWLAASRKAEEAACWDRAGVSNNLEN